MSVAKAAEESVREGRMRAGEHMPDRVSTGRHVFACPACDSRDCNCMGMQAVWCAGCGHPLNGEAMAWELASARAGRPRPYLPPGIPGVDPPPDVPD